MPGTVRKEPLGNFCKPALLIEFPGGKGVRHQTHGVSPSALARSMNRASNAVPNPLRKFLLEESATNSDITALKVAVVSLPRLLEKGAELLLKRGGQFVSPQVELQKHSGPRPIVPPGIAPAGQCLAEPLAVFAADKSYDLLLLRDGDIGEIALFNQNLAIIVQNCLFIPPHCVYILSSTPELPVTIPILHIREFIKYHE